MELVGAICRQVHGGNEATKKIEKGEPIMGQWGNGAMGQWVLFKSPVRSGFFPF
jgi:hypothetical protein